MAVHVAVTMFGVGRHAQVLPAEGTVKVPPAALDDFEQFRIVGLAAVEKKPLIGAILESILRLAPVFFPLEEDAPSRRLRRTEVNCYSVPPRNSSWRICDSILGLPPAG